MFFFGFDSGGCDMLTIYKIEMDSRLGYWEATCGVDGQEFTVHASAWIDAVTNGLMVVQVGGNCQRVNVWPHWAEIKRAIREAIVAGWSVSEAGRVDGFNTGGCDNG